MKTLLQIVLICFVVGVFAQNLSLPTRETNALGGASFAQKVSALNLAGRESAIVSEIFAGNVPTFLRKFCPVTVTNVAGGETNLATFYAAPDYLAIGSDENYFLTPMSPNTAQRIADRLGCVLPTRKMVDAIYSAAEVKLAPTPIPPSVAMTTVPIFLQHNEMVRTQRWAFRQAFSLSSPKGGEGRGEEALLFPDQIPSPQPSPRSGGERESETQREFIPLGALVAGHQKDVVISARLAGVTNKVAIYGWHQTNGLPIQPLYLGHAASWVDYSQCIRLIKREMMINGEIKSIAEVLADPKLCGLISDEGVITNARYPTNAIAPAASVKIDLPWPEKFSASAHFGEMVREIELPDGVRIVINAPSTESFVPDKPVLLVFFALPNGNTIEQTIGKTLKPGDDWHFDIQHIGAQTRWLRAALTNRTIVVAYLEAAVKSWPAWRKTHDDQTIVNIVDDVRKIFPGRKLEVALTSHSGGGSLMFGYLNAVEKIPDDVVRIAFLDSNYAYDTRLHSEKLKRWLADSDGHRLCVLAYHDSVALLNGKTFVSEQGGTWGRSHLMLDDLGAQFKFTGSRNNGLETFSALDGRMQFLLKENPEKKIFHTVQVERNGFIHALVSGTTDEGRGYEYFGERAYLKWIQGEP